MNVLSSFKKSYLVLVFCYPWHCIILWLYIFLLLPSYHTLGVITCYFALLIQFRCTVCYFCPPFKLKLHCVTTASYLNHSGLITWHLLPSFQALGVLSYLYAPIILWVYWVTFALLSYSGCTVCYICPPIILWVYCVLLYLCPHIILWVYCVLPLPSYHTLGVLSYLCPPIIL